MSTISKNYYFDYFFKTSQFNTKIKKNVSFYNEVKVILIPSRKEIFYAKLCNELWFSEKDLIRFKIETFGEITEMRKKHPGINRTQVFKLLYQPNNISFNESNF